MRIALFPTCLVDALFPGGRGRPSCPRAPGARGRVPPRPRRAAARCTSTAATRTRRCPWCASTSRRSSRTDVVVAPSGSCVGSVRHQHAGVALAPATRRSPAAPRRSPHRVYELSELLVDVLGVTDVGAWYPHRVTYHPTCHSLRMLRVGDRPLQLLREVRGIDLVELPGAESAAGSAGPSRSRTRTCRRRCSPTSGAVATPGPRSAPPATPPA